MKQLTIRMDETTSRIIDAQAILRGVSQEELVAQHGVNGVVIQATQEQIQKDVAAGTVQDDVKNLVDWSSLWQGVERERQAGRMPQSIVDGLERRSLAVLDAKRVGGAG